jgi:hypothetical protein
VSVELVDRDWNTAIHAGLGRDSSRTSGRGARGSLCGRDAAVVAKARARGSMPALFSGGDLPSFIASGFDPRVLLSVP